MRRESQIVAEFWSLKRAMRGQRRSMALTAFCVLGCIAMVFALLPSVWALIPGLIAVAQIAVTDEIARAYRRNRTAHEEARSVLRRLNGPRW